MQGLTGTLKIETQHSLKHRMVELKARVGDHDFLRKSLSALGAERVGTFRQTDSYFRVPEGRLKLREVEDGGTAELIYYEIYSPKALECIQIYCEISDSCSKAWLRCHQAHGRNPSEVLKSCL